MVLLFLCQEQPVVQPRLALCFLDAQELMICGCCSESNTLKAYSSHKSQNSRFHNPQTTHFTKHKPRFKAIYHQLFNTIQKGHQKANHSSTISILRTKNFTTSTISFKLLQPQNSKVVPQPNDALACHKPNSVPKQNFFHSNFLPNTWRTLFLHTIHRLHTSQLTNYMHNNSQPNPQR